MLYNDPNFTGEGSSRLSQKKIAEQTDKKDIFSGDFLKNIRNISNSVIASIEKQGAIRDEEIRVKNERIKMKRDLAQKQAVKEIQEITTVFGLDGKEGSVYENIEKTAVILKEYFKRNFGLRYNMYYFSICELRMKSLLTALYSIFQSTNLEGKKIVDLACGATGKSVEVDLNKDYRLWEPWNSRALFALGVDVIGIDIGDLSFESFSHHQTDITKENALKFLSDSTIDAVFMKDLYGSPELSKYTKKYSEYENEAYLKGIIFPQISRIVVPGGYFIENDEVLGMQLYKVDPASKRLEIFK